MPPDRVVAFVCPSSSAFLHHHIGVAVAASKVGAVHVLVTPDGDDAVGSRLPDDSGILFHEVPISRKSVNPARILWEALRLRRMLRRIKPDIINAINLKAVLVTSMANVGLPSRLINTIPGLGYMFAGDSPRRRALRSLTSAALRFLWKRQPNLAVFSNRDDLEEFVGQGVVGKERARVIPVPGVDLRRYCPSPEPEGGFRVVLPARMLWDKGVGEFVAAARELRPVLPGSEFILAGRPDPGNPGSIPRETLEGWSAGGIVRWLGHCDDIPGLFSSCHAVCLPTRYREGMPRVLAEAMACARPVVTTTVPGCRDLDSGAGLLVEPGNVPMLTEALARLYRNPEERREMGRRGREKAVESYDAGLIVSRVLQCFQEV